jgi:flagellar biosynthesis regulator FlaF
MVVPYETIESIMTSAYSYQVDIYLYSLSSEITRKWSAGITKITWLSFFTKLWLLFIGDLRTADSSFPSGNSCSDIETNIHQLSIWYIKWKYNDEESIHQVKVNEAH